MAHELVAAVAATGFGRLVLTAPDRISMRERCELLSLVGELSHKLRGSTATVSVRFGEASRREIGPGDGIGGEMVAYALRYHGLAQSA
jgi:hypothetical protein